MRCPFATWRGTVPNMTPKAMIGHRGLILHVQQGQEAGTDSWFHNPAAQASAHFGVAADGHLDQWVDTDDKAWAQAAGNPFWVSVEIAGYSGRPATGAQVTTLAHLWAWLRELYRWPDQATDTPLGSGLGWHGMGGRAWGGHADCPGQPIKDQRPEILAAPSGPPPAPPAVPVSRFLLNGEQHVRITLPVETDSFGNGWLPPLANVDEAKMVAVTVQGSDPDTAVDNRYWPGSGHWQDRGGHPLISITGALPNQQAVNVFVVYGE